MTERDERRPSRLRGLAAVFRPLDLAILAVSGYFLVILDGILKAVVPGPGSSILFEYGISLGLAVLFAGVVVGLAPFSAGRLARPLARLRDLLDRAAGGDLSGRIPVERGDTLRPVVEEANLLLANLRERVATDRARLSEASRILHRLRNEAPPAMVPRLNGALEELEKVTAELHLAPEGDPDREPTGEWVRGATPSSPVRQKVTGTT